MAKKSDLLDPETISRAEALGLHARYVVEGYMAGEHKSPFRGFAIEFTQHREYVPGDDIRHLDWKVLGRTDRVYLKQYQQETNLQLLCVVDASESMTYGSVVGEDKKPWTKFDHATAIAAALSYMAIQQQDSVGMAIFDQSLTRYFKPSNAPVQWKMLVNELQLVPKWNKTNTGKILDQLAEKLHHRSLIVLLSDFFDDIENLKKGLRHLRYKKHEVMAFQILDPSEVEFPFEDTTLFKGLEELGEMLTEPRALREGYLEQLNQHTAALQKLCRGMLIDFVRMNSGEPLDAALSGFLATRAATMK